MSSRYKYRYGIELSKEWMYSWIRVAHPICQKYQGGCRGGLFILLLLCLLVYYLLICCLISRRLCIRRCVYTYMPACMYLHGLLFAYLLPI